MPKLLEEHIKRVRRMEQRGYVSTEDKYALEAVLADRERLQVEINRLREKLGWVPAIFSTGEK